MNFIKTIFLVLVSFSPALSFALSNGTDSDCDVDWHSFGNKCFKYHNDLVGANFHNAVSICERTHLAQLATIHSEEEAKFINWMLFDFHNSKFSAWIGLVRVNNETFTWLDRSPLNYTNWAPNEPNNWNSKNFCVVLSSEPTFKGLWYDVGCTSTYVVICEKQKKDKQKRTKNEKLLANNIEQLQESVILLQNHIAQIQISMNSLQSHFENNGDASLKNNSLFISQKRIHLNTANFVTEDLTSMKLSQKSMWSLTQINFALVIIALILIFSSATYVCFCSPSCRHLQLHPSASSSDSSSNSGNTLPNRHKPWHNIRLAESQSNTSSYVPSSLDRLYRSTLGKLKSASSSCPQPLSASYTATRQTSDTESILTTENAATSI